MGKKWSWNITFCKAVYHRHKKANYNFYIVDYDIQDSWEKYPQIIEMRNAGIVKTKYFHTKKEALEFLNQYTSGEVLTPEKIKKAVRILEKHNKDILINIESTIDKYDFLS